MLGESSDPQDAETTIDRRSAHVGIVCTTNAEISPLLNKVDRQRKYVDNGATFRGGFIDETIRLAFVEAGPGFAQHRQAALTLIAEHNPRWVLSVGFSSPLNNELNQGDLCLANEICDTHGNSLTVKCQIAESKRVFVRKHVVADAHPGSAAERSQLAADTSAAAVDTTSLAVAQACVNAEEGQRSPRFMSVRGIVSSFDRDLPAKVVTHIFEPEGKDNRSVIAKLTNRIRKDPELSEWNEFVAETAINLNRFLLSLIRQLAEKLD